jgi:hypothetical protein
MGNQRRHDIGNYPMRTFAISGEMQLLQRCEAPSAPGKTDLKEHEAVQDAPCGIAAKCGENHFHNIFPARVMHVEQVKFSTMKPTNLGDPVNGINDSPGYCPGTLRLNLAVHVNLP